MFRLFFMCSRGIYSSGYVCLSLPVIAYVRVLHMPEGNIKVQKYSIATRRENHGPEVTKGRERAAGVSHVVLWRTCCCTRLVFRSVEGEGGLASPKSVRSLDFVMGRKASALHEYQQNNH